MRGGPGNTAEAARGSRMPAGHPEGYIEGFANLYRDAAELIRARRAGSTPDPAADGGRADRRRRRQGHPLRRSRGGVEPRGRALDVRRR